MVKCRRLMRECKMDEKVRTLPKIWILGQNPYDKDNHHDFNKGEKVASAYMFLYSYSLVF